jgi:HD-like signal output (HDOD) protein
VDDEPRVLEGLENLLRPHRREWKMTFVLGGNAAVDLLETQRFDVVVSDVRMPGIDGAALLRFVRDKYPDTVRVVLSGYADAEASMRALPLAHQFLSKPCDPALLQSVLGRSCELQSGLDDDALKRMVGKLERLPSLPTAYLALTKVLESENASIDDVAHIVESDVAMTAKILQLVNSPFFRTAQRITGIRTAIAYLGLLTIRNLALSAHVFAESKGTSGIPTQQEHAMAVAVTASRIVSDRSLSDDAFAAGMLHDVGKLVLAEYDPHYVKEVLERTGPGGPPAYLMERGRFGVSHAEVGGYLLGLWGIPARVVEAVTGHHEPIDSTSPELRVREAVYIANALCSTSAPAGPQLVAWRETFGHVVPKAPSP